MVVIHRRKYSSAVKIEPLIHVATSVNPKTLQSEKKPGGKDYKCITVCITFSKDKVLKMENRSVTTRGYG